MRRAALGWSICIAWSTQEFSINLLELEPSSMHRCDAVRLT